MEFDVTSRERKNKADWDVETGSTAQKRQRIVSPLKISNIQNVSKITLQQHRLPSPEVSITKTKVSLVQSSFEVVLNGKSSERKKATNQTAGHYNMILIVVKEKLVRE